MSERPFHLFNDRILNDVSMGASVSSAIKTMNEAVSYSVQAIWSGGGVPIGTLDLQASNDGSNFDSVLEAPIDISGNSGQILINVEKHAYAHIQIVYTRTSGTATLNVYVNGKRG